jgi:hypothetical protein
MRIFSLQEIHAFRRSQPSPPVPGASVAVSHREHLNDNRIHPIDHRKGKSVQDKLSAARNTGGLSVGRISDQRNGVVDFFNKTRSRTFAAITIPSHCRSDLFERSRMNLQLSRHEEQPRFAGAPQPTKPASPRPSPTPRCAAQSPDPTRPPPMRRPSRRGSPAALLPARLSPRWATPSPASARQKDPAP